MASPSGLLDGRRFGNVMSHNIVDTYVSIHRGQCVSIHRGHLAANPVLTVKTVSELVGVVSTFASEPFDAGYTPIISLRVFESCADGDA